MIEMNVFLAILYCLMFGIAVICFCKHENDMEELKKNAMDGLHSLPLFQNIIQTQKELFELSKTYHEMLELLQQEVKLLKDESKKKGGKHDCI